MFSVGFYDVAEHWLIYLLVICGILYVAGFALISMRRSWRRAKEIGYTTEKLKNVVKSSISYTIVPSIAIVVGFFSIAAMLGIPWPWWRLSVIGSVTYELMAANMALGAAGVDLAAATGKEFVLIMFVMTIGILGGLVTVPFIGERIQSGTMKMKDRDQRWGSLGSSVFMVAIIIVFTVPMLFDGPVKLATLLTSFAVAFLLSTAAKKFKIAWLGNFVLAFTLLISMASSVLWTNLFA